jgi:two-component system response regulator AlgR
VIRALVVDDEWLAIEALASLLERSGRVEILGYAADGEAALQLASAKSPDVIFLDISMPGMSGLATAARLRANAAATVVFVTAHDHYATEAFDLAVVDYVLKPVEEDRLERALDRVEEHVSRHLPRTSAATGFWVPTRGGMAHLPMVSIRRVDADRDYVHLVTHERSFMLREPISAIEERLDPTQFLRVHRSTILRTSDIAWLKKLGAGAWAAVTHNHEIVRIGRSHLAQVRAACEGDASVRALGAGEGGRR